jgi:hypothetical protein
MMCSAFQIELCCEYIQLFEYTKKFVFGPGELYLL